MSNLSATDLASLTLSLRAMKARVVGEIIDVSDDMAASLTQADHEVQDQVDDAEDKRMDTVRAAETEIDRATLADIELAEKRIAEGSYGLCVNCNEEIPRERLFAHPTAIRCITCQSLNERQHAGR